MMPRPRDEAARDSGRAEQEQAEWVARIREGDARAFEAMFDAFYAPLVAYAFSVLRSRERAEEIIQEIFLSVWTNRSTWTITRSLNTYLYQAVRNRVYNEHRSLRLERRYGETMVREISAEATAERAGNDRADSALSEDDLRRALDRAVAQLPDRARQVFLLNRQQQLTYAQIADVLDISMKTVEMHMTRALAALRESLADWRR